MDNKWYYPCAIIRYRSNDEIMFQSTYQSTTKEKAIEQISIWKESLGDILVSWLQETGTDKIVKHKINCKSAEYARLFKCLYRC